MKAAFINLETASARRVQVEAGFAAVPHEGWSLARFAAVTAAEMSEAPGALRPAEKACFESHRRLIGQHLDDQAPLYVLEDDVAFSKAAFPVLAAMAQAPGDWEVLFTDAAFLQAGYLVQAARDWERLTAAGQVQLVPLKGAAFVGATAYLVRGSAKAKLHGLLQAVETLDRPYDIVLRDLVAAGALNAAVTLPFLTTLSPDAADSQIQVGTDLQLRAFDAFRRLTFIERDLDASRRAIEAIGAELPEADRLAGTLLAAAMLAR